MNALRRRSKHLSAALAAVAIVLAAGGCNIVAPIALLVHGPEKSPALYTLDPARPTVVFVDDRSSVLPSRAIRQRIAQAAEGVLLDGGVLKADLISSDALLPIVTADRFTRPKSIAEMGRAVNADVVVYATVDTFTLSPNGSEYAPSASLRVKVIDAKNDVRMWPDKESSQDWHRVEVNIPTKASFVPKNSSEVMIAQQDLADRLGRALGNVFVKHETREANERIGQ